jgi:hypothetical protein
MAITNDDVVTMGKSLVRDVEKRIEETLEYEADKQRVYAYLAGWFEGTMRHGS